MDEFQNENTITYAKTAEVWKGTLCDQANEGYN